MSTAALAIKQRHKLRQIEFGPDSEEFTIVESGSTFRGIFDRSYGEGRKDAGNVTQKNLSPLILIAKIPEGVSEGSTAIKREGWQEGDKIFTLQFIGKDEEGIPVLWLF